MTHCLVCIFELPLMVHTAHQDVYQNAKILHRDLSVGNIIIYQGKGFLINWDLAKLVIIQGPQQMTCTVSSFHAQTHCINFFGIQGTWQFRSAHLVKNTHTVHGIEDDLEFSLYIVLWTALMYRESHMTVVYWMQFIMQVFRPVPSKMKLCSACLSKVFCLICLMSNGKTWTQSLNSSHSTVSSVFLGDVY